MNEDEIVKSLSETRVARGTLYLSVGKVDELYSQCVNQITEIVRGAKEGDKISASLFKVLGAELSGETVLTAKTTLTSGIKAILVEASSRGSGQLVDLSRELPKTGSLLKYVGDSRITLMDSRVTPERTSLSDVACGVVQQERDEQQEVLRFRDAKVGTIVWTAVTDTGLFASIASTEEANLNLLASYWSVPPFGLIGRIEKSRENVTFISPVWIWHEGW